MTVKELADVCRVHYNTMRKWLADNKIKKVDKAVNSPYLITDDVIKKARNHFLVEDPKTEEKKEEIDNILIQQLILLQSYSHSLLHNLFNNSITNCVTYCITY